MVREEKKATSKPQANIEYYYYFFVKYGIVFVLVLAEKLSAQEETKMK